MERHAMLGFFQAPGRPDRIKAMVGMVLLEIALAYVFILGLGVRMPAAVRERLDMVGIAPEPLPQVKQKVRPRSPSRRREGAASPPNLKAKATDIVAPRPPLPLPVRQPLPAAPVPGTGAAAFAGASNVRGPGTGSGGQGVGTGSGGSGYGSGGGYAVAARWLRGRLRNRDYPRAAGSAGVEGVVSVRFTVAPSGRAIQCIVTRSSGNAALDGTTCGLIEQRYRYKPAMDRSGRPVASTVEETHEWVVHSEIIDDPPSD